VMSPPPPRLTTSPVLFTRIRSSFTALTLRGHRVHNVSPLSWLTLCSRSRISYRTVDNIKMYSTQSKYIPSWTKDNHDKLKKGHTNAKFCHILRDKRLTLFGLWYFRWMLVPATLHLLYAWSLTVPARRLANRENTYWKKYQISSNRSRYKAVGSSLYV
jgi:hypothetical protein